MDARDGFGRRRGRPTPASAACAAAAADGVPSAFGGGAGDDDDDAHTSAAAAERAFQRAAARRATSANSSARARLAAGGSALYDAAGRAADARAREARGREVEPAARGSSAPRLGERPPSVPQTARATPSQNSARLTDGLTQALGARQAAERRAQLERASPEGGRLARALAKSTIYSYSPRRQLAASRARHQSRGGGGCSPSRASRRRSTSSSDELTNAMSSRGREAATSPSAQELPGANYSSLSALPRAARAVSSARVEGLVGGEPLAPCGEALRCSCSVRASSSSCCWLCHTVETPTSSRCPSPPCSPRPPRRPPPSAAARSPRGARAAPSTP